MSTESGRRWDLAHPGNLAERAKRWSEKNPERAKAASRECMMRRRAAFKAEMIAAYGGCCQCCGESNPKFLTLEHIGGRTGQEAENGIPEFRRLQKLGWPDTCTCLCYNCNMASAKNGHVCPHKDPV